MTADQISQARSSASYISDDLHLAYFDTPSREHWLRCADENMHTLAERMGYVLTPIAAPETHRAALDAVLSMPPVADDVYGVAV